MPLCYAVVFEINTAKLPQRYGMEKATPYEAGCTSLPVAAHYHCETNLNTEATEIVVMLLVVVAQYVIQLAV